MANGVPPRWPDGRRFALSLTFDVDAEAPLLAGSEDNSPGPSAISEWRYGVHAGLERIREYLRDRELQATFYVPGYTAVTYPRQVEPLVEEGHEIGHHGHMHRNPEQLSVDDQRREIDDGLEALQRVLGVRPVGYRAPYLGLTEDTASLLHKYSFEYDSSCMGDDLPYFEQLGGDHLLELPVHWSMDDGVYLGWTPGGQAPATQDWVDSWAGEIDQTRVAAGHISLMCHPHWTGRPRQFNALSRVIDEAFNRGDAWIAPQREVAALARSHLEEERHGKP